MNFDFSRPYPNSDKLSQLLKKFHHGASMRQMSFPRSDASGIIEQKTTPATPPETKKVDP